MPRSSISVLAFAFLATGCGTPPKEAEHKKAKTASKPTPAKDDEPDQPPEVARADKLERGKYLAEVVMNCKACHTPLGESGPDLDKAYAGGLEFPESFGTWRSPNITQDVNTGIGGWTDEQIILAVREGKRPTGEQMYAFMPYQYFATASDEDMEALVAYLRTVKPIANPVPRNAGLDTEKPPHRPATPQSPGFDPVERGKYLTQLAHCGGCHTPLKADGTPDAAKHFAGGVKFSALEFQGTGEVWSANLTPDKKTGIGRYSDIELMRAIVELDKRDGSAIVGPMTFYVRAWSELKHKDVEAIAAYLRSLEPIENNVPKSTWKPANVDLAQK